MNRKPHAKAAKVATDEEKRGIAIPAPRRFHAQNYFDPLRSSRPLREAVFFS